MDFWNKLNKDATRLFNSRQYLKAINKYTRSLERSLLLMDKSSDPKLAVEYFTSSLHGLSESYLQIEEYDYAVSSVIRGHNLMQQLIELNDAQPNFIESFRQAKRFLESYIGYLMTEYPEVHICSHCYERIFGYACLSETSMAIQ